ncbi:DUF4397 domain-containing protein [Tessaracoccus sp. OS52]|uniref:DUF4397 domain-containing protein n=1 Tax=Tessaracoccus sp. OS52 TaxID=2886691 RepID=UPI001D11FC44|nr:DUF4397 domain-containing protein [Tessaracoccus sp. OS52]MCC2592449.1 DUF4397 domain-containing protein [Tessaracoccus sp. OS52]
MKLSRIFLAGSLALAATVGTAATAMADEHTATVSILHGVPGATVDVYANGSELLTNFEPGTLTDPQELPAGTYDLKVVAAGAGADGEAVIEANDVTVPADANITVVAHLNADGAPVLTPFVNDTSASSEGARLTVRHVAAAPAVDVRAGGAVVVPGLTNPSEAKLDLAPGTVAADVVAAGSDTVVLGPADLTLTDGTNSIVYAWGSLEDENLALAVQAVELGDHAGLPSAGAEGPAPVAPITIALASLVLVGATASFVVARGARVRSTN